MHTKKASLSGLFCLILSRQAKIGRGVKQKSDEASSKNRTRRQAKIGRGVKQKSDEASRKNPTGDMGTLYRSQSLKRQRRKFYFGKVFVYLLFFLFRQFFDIGGKMFLSERKKLFCRKFHELVKADSFSV